jgi:hypothetical protein
MSPDSGSSMTFDLLPPVIPRWLRVMIGVTAGVMVIRAIFDFEEGNVWHGMYLIVLALLSTQPGKVLRFLTPFSVHLDEIGIIQRGASESMIPWESVEKIRSGPNFIGLYYKRGPEPRLLELDAARFRSDDWEVIRSFILSRAQGAQSGK